jgi:acyl-CoA thioesterase-1
LSNVDPEIVMAARGAAGVHRHHASRRAGAGGDAHARACAVIGRRASLAVIAWIATFGILGCSRKRGGVSAKALAADATVLAFGDSITYGTGASPEAAYPAQLAALTGWNVINGGVPGDTAENALERLPALLAEHRPALVIIGIGGNDFLRRVAPDVTRSAVRRAIELASGAGAQVLLVAIPQLSAGAALGLGLSDHPMYEELARELALPLHAGGWSRVLGDAALRADAIHANAAGYRAFAEGLAATLKQAGLVR